MAAPFNSGVRFKWTLPYWKFSAATYMPDLFHESDEFIFSGTTFCLKLKPREPYMEGLDNHDGSFNTCLYLCAKEFGLHEDLKIRRHIWLEDNAERMIPVAKEGEQRFLKADYDWKTCVFKIPEIRFEETESYSYPSEVTIFCDLYYDTSEMEQKLNVWREKIEELADEPMNGRCTIRVDGKVLKIAKLLLMMNSEVFERMFLCESQEATTGIVEIKDASAEVMQLFVEYLKTGKIDLDNHPEALFVLSDKYAVKDLQDKCIDHLIKTLDETNFLPRLAMAFTYGSFEFREKIVKHVSDPGKTSNFLDIIKSDEWKNFDVENQQLSNDIYDSVFAMKKWN